MILRWFNHLLSLGFSLHVEECIKKKWKENSRTHIQILGLQNVLPSSRWVFNGSHESTNEDQGVYIVFLGRKIVLLLQNANLSEVFVSL